MMNFFSKIILNFFDFFHKKKILKELKKNRTRDKFEVVLDVGAHEGESLKLFLENFEIENIYSFEPSVESFKKLTKNYEKLKKKYFNTNFHIENFAVGSINRNIELNYLKETSSSTLRNLNFESKYFKKKERFFGKLIDKKSSVKEINFEEYLIKNKINSVDLLKIDTEGYELEVIKGLNNSLAKVSMIIFEHHYDNMIKKGYTFTDINKLLRSKKFKLVFKAKMPFRKTFEYIYQNQS